MSSMSMAIREKVVRISVCFLVVASLILSVSSALEDVNQFEGQVLKKPHVLVEFKEPNFLVKFYNSLKGSAKYTHVWPEMEIGWRMIVGTLIAFIGASFGSAGGSCAGGIFVPMLTLIVGFDAKSSAAISKCMIMGLTGAAISCNIKQKHPTLNLPLIDYDLALLVQPMLLLGISTGVTFNVIFPDWLVTILLIIAFLVTSSRSLLKGVQTWKMETIKKKEAAQLRKSNGQNGDQIEYTQLPGGPTERSRVSIAENVYWKELGILVGVWFAFLVIQISKDYSTTCSVVYWVLNLLQIPVALGATWYQAVKLHSQSRHNGSSAGEVRTQAHDWSGLILCAFVALLAGTLGGLLGLGGGFVLNPLFLEIGVIPQVSSATAIFVMVFSSSMCAIEYYLLSRFPVPYALYFVAIATVASLLGQYVVKKWIARFGRPSLIVFILSSIIFASAILLGGEGIANMIYKIEHNEFMGFEDLCAAST